MGADDIAMRASLDAGPFSDGIDTMISKAEMLGQKMGGAMGGIGGKINDVGQAMGLNEGKIGALGGALGMTGVAFTGVAIGATALAAGLNASVQSAGSYQNQMAQVGAITGQTTVGMDALNKTMGRETTYSMSESAQAMGMLADEGFRTQEMASALPATLKLAEAGHMDMGSAVKALDNSLDQFKMTAGDSDKVVNELVAAAQKGNTSVGDLASAMAMAGPTAAAFGLSFTDVTASLSLMTGAGMSSRQAGANLKSMMDSLTTPSKSLADGLGAIGLSTDDVSPKLHSFGSILETLKEHGVDSQKAMDLFGTSAGPGMAALLDESKGSFDQYSKSLENTTAATDAAQKASNTYDGQMKKFGNTMDELKISAGTALLPALTETVGALNEGVKAAIDFGDALEKAMNGPSGEGHLKPFVDKLLGRETISSVPGGVLDMSKMVSDTYVDNFNVDGLGAKVDAGLATANPGQAAQDAAAEYTKVYGSRFEAGMTYGSDYISKATGKLMKGSGVWASNQSSDITGGIIGATTSHGVQLTTTWGYGSNKNLYQLKDGSGKVIASTRSVSGTSDPDTQEGHNNIVNQLLRDAKITTLSDIETLELKGDTVGAAKLKLAAPLVVETLWDLTKFDGDKGLKGYLESLNQWFAKNPVDIDKDIVKGLGDNLLKAMGEDISLSNLPIIEDSLTGLFKKYNYSGTYGDLSKNISEKYKTSIKEGIVDSEDYAKNEMGRFGQEISKAFEDNFLSPGEIDLLKNLGPQLDFVKDVAVDEFFKGGGLAMDALVRGLENGDMSAVKTALAALRREVVKTLYDPLAEPKNMGMVFDSFIGSTKDYPKFMEEKLRQEHAVHDAMQEITLMKAEVAADEAKSDELINTAIENMGQDKSPVQLQIAGSEAEQFGKSLEKTQTILDTIQEKKLTVHADTSEIDQMSETLEKIKEQVDGINDGPEVDPGSDSGGAGPKKSAWSGFGGSNGMADYSGAGDLAQLPQAGEETYIKTGQWTGTDQYGQKAQGSSYYYLPSPIKWANAPLGSPSGNAYTLEGQRPGGGNTMYSADDAAKVEALNSSIQGLPNSKQVNLHVVVDRVDFDVFLSSLAGLKPKVSVEVDVSANTAQIVSIVEAAVASALDSIRA